MNHRMAKYGNSSTAYCTKCCESARVSIETIEPEVSYADRGSTYVPRTQRITIECGCDAPRYFNGTTDYKAKETTVTQQYDTTTEKSVALSNIKNRVTKLEGALYNRVEALTKTQNEHSKLISEASNALDRVLAEASQVGIDHDTLKLHLPEYADELGTRLSIVYGLMDLVTVSEVV